MKYTIAYKLGKDIYGQIVSGTLEVSIYEGENVKTLTHELDAHETNLVIADPNSIYPIAKQLIADTMVQLQKEQVSVEDNSAMFADFDASGVQEIVNQISVDEKIVAPILDIASPVYVAPIPTP